MSIPEGMIRQQRCHDALPWLISFSLDREAVFHFHPLGRLDALLAMLWEHFCSGAFAMTNWRHVYEVRPREDKHGVDLISDALPVWSAVVWRAERGQQRNRLREVFQPLA
jgi:hypothetical protein